MAPMVDKRTIQLFQQRCEQWSPKPRLTVSQWADNNRVLTTESSAEPGPWRTDRAPYQREIMDSIEHWQEVVIMASAQVGKTEFLLNVTGSYIDQDPCPIMHMLPNDDLIKSYSTKRLQPMINASAPLTNKVTAAKGREAGNTMEEKSYPGGYITIVGANSAANLSSRPIQVVLCDEVDRYPVSAGKEGDPVKLATARTTTFRHKRRHLFVSTPLDKDTSRIYEMYEDSTAEKWNMRCPHCGELQPLEFTQLDFEYYASESGEIVVTRAEYRCIQCGMLGTEKAWKSSEGEWVATKTHTKRRGFHINQLASPWSDWRTIAGEFLIAKREGPEKLKTFINTVLGEPWEEKRKQMNHKQLQQRQYDYGADVPAGVKILTAAIDTQSDRLEVEVIGWGAGKENWRIEYHRIYGNLATDQPWNDLREYLQRHWQDARGWKFPIAAAFIDSGGHFTKEVYDFAAPLEHRKIYAIKGMGQNTKSGETIPLIYRQTTTDLSSAKLFILGVDEGKAKVVAGLKITEPGPLYSHFPKQEKGYTEEYFLSLTAEIQKRKRVDGVERKIWIKIRNRNEAFDLAVYNRAVIELLNPPLSDMDPWAFRPDIITTPGQPAQKLVPKRRQGVRESI